MKNEKIKEVEITFCHDEEVCKQKIMEINLKKGKTGNTKETFNKEY